MSGLTQRDFERLLEFRVTLRRFQRWSEDQAKAAGLTHVQHQLLVAIKGHPGGQPPTVGDLHELAAVLDEFVTAHNGTQYLYRNTI